MTGQPDQAVFTKEEVRGLYHSLNEARYLNHLDTLQVIDFFQSELDGFCSEKFFCEECGSEWSCNENRCVAQCGESRE